MTRRAFGLANIVGAWVVLVCAGYTWRQLGDQVGGELTAALAVLMLLRGLYYLRDPLALRVGDLPAWWRRRHRHAGHVHTWHDATGRLMVGLRCTACGQLTGVHPVPRRITEGRPNDL